MPPAEFHQRLRELTKKHGILLIADEVQSGMGRTGRMFACEHFGLDADIVTVAKGIASGLPLGVTSARSDVMTWPPGAHASTFGGNPGQRRPRRSRRSSCSRTASSGTPRSWAST